MARFPDALAALLATEGMAFPDGFEDDLTAAYNEDIAASAAESNTVIAARDEMIRQLKAQAAIDVIPPEAATALEEPGEDDEVEADFSDFFGEKGDDEDPDNK